MTAGSADLHRLDATTALRLFRSRELSPVELMEALITRIEDVDVAVNALSERLFDTALAAVRLLQRRHVEEDERLAQVVVRAEAADCPGRDADDGGRLACPRALAVRP